MSYKETLSCVSAQTSADSCTLITRGTWYSVYGLWDSKSEGILQTDTHTLRQTGKQKCLKQRFVKFCQSVHRIYKCLSMPFVAQCD